MAKRYELKVDRVTALATIERVAAAHELFLGKHGDSVLVYQGDQDLGVITVAERGDGSEVVVGIEPGGLPKLVIAFSVSVLIGLAYYLSYGVAAALIRSPMGAMLLVNIALWWLILRMRASKRTAATVLAEALTPLSLAAPTEVRALPAPKDK